MSNLDSRVEEFLSQKRIAVAGVSRTTERHPAANLIYQRLKQTGHEVFAVNPSLESFEGEPCFASVKAIPGGVDGVVIVTRPKATEAIVRDCAEAGVPHVWMHQSMDKGGTSVSKEAVQFCHEHQIDVIDGACPMMYGKGADFGHRCMRWMLGLTGGLPKG